MSLQEEEKSNVKNTSPGTSEYDATPQLPQVTEHNVTSSPILNLANIATLPITLVFHLIKNVLSFLQGNAFARIPALVPSTMKIAILTEEQEEIMQTTPSVQKTLQANMSKAKHDQEMIEVDIDDLKKRLTRIEARMKRRSEMQ